MLQTQTRCYLLLSTLVTLKLQQILIRFCVQMHLAHLSMLQAQHLHMSSELKPFSNNSFKMHRHPMEMGWKQQLQQLWSI